MKSEAPLRLILSVTVLSDLDYRALIVQRFQQEFYRNVVTLVLPFG